MPEWFSGDVVANGMRIHYHRTGGGKPPLVLSHGATDSGLCWTRVTRALESDYDVILPDARGHGTSDAPPSGYSSSRRAADLAGLIDALGLKRPAVGGHSMGAATTLYLVAEYPDLASCAILEDPGLRSGERGPSRPGQGEPRNALRRIVLDAQADGLEATIARGRAASPTWAEEEFESWAEAKMQVSRRFLDDSTRTGPANEWRELLPRVKCPVLLVTSDPELGSIVTPVIAQEAARLLPSLRLVRLSGAGHNIRREQFKPFVREVRNFLAAAYAPAAL
ncbi:MAG: alpha/beta fold hydrolase [Chloroflexota bacterium]